MKYPANPPAVGDPATIAQRTKLFFLMLLVSLAQTDPGSPQPLLAIPTG